MDKLFIPLILGTAREGRQTEKVARFVYGVLEELPMFTTQFVDIRDFLFGKTIDDQTDQMKGWRDIVIKAHGLIIVTPEYNHSFPGELKILLDSLDEEYIDKPVGICGVSSGQFGGARMIDHIKPVLVALGMFPLQTGVHFPNVEELVFYQNISQDETYKKRIIRLAEEVVRVAIRLQ